MQGKRNWTCTYLIFGFWSYIGVLRSVFSFGQYNLLGNMGGSEGVSLLLLLYREQRTLTCGWREGRKQRDEML